MMLLLHLSDIHFREGEVGTAMDPNAHLRSELLLDAVAQCQRIGAIPDAVLVSGDVAFAGEPYEYAYALTWLDRLCRDCGTSRASRAMYSGPCEAAASITPI
jgi:3',5'-cyclic AMP phosphodiesterase CpdA